MWDRQGIAAVTVTIVFDVRPTQTAAPLCRDDDSSPETSVGGYCVIRCCYGPEDAESLTIARVEIRCDDDVYIFIFNHTIFNTLHKYF